MLVLLAMLIAISPSMPARAEDIDQSQVYIMSINSTNGSESVMIRNDGADISATNMRLLFFNSSIDNKNPTLIIEFGSGIFLANSSLLVSQSTATTGSFDKAYSADRIALSGGRLVLEIDGSVVLENCWGSIKICSSDRNAPAMSSNKPILVSPCITGTGSCQSLELSTTSPELLFGGWQPVVDEEPAPPSDPTNPDCENLKITEIGAYPGGGIYGRQFIELTNTSDRIIDIQGCRLIPNKNTTTKYASFDNETLEPNGIKLLFMDEYKELSLSKTVAGIVYVLSSDGTTELDVQAYPALKAGTSWWKIGEEWQVSKQPSPGLPNVLPTVNYCEGVKLSEVGANIDNQFIEIVNSSDQTVTLRGCQLMTNRSATKYFEFGDEALEPGSFRVIAINDTPLGLTKTTTGTVYLYSSDGETEVDSTTYASLAKDTSWSMVDGEWIQTYTPTPGQRNIFQEYPSCQEGYYRNLDTGRCNKIVTIATVAACAAGYYRNESTNRCRKIVTTATLTPCKEGQERNPETNRCRRIAATTSTVKPCADGYERNAETNRCRKIVSSAQGQFAVEAGPPSSASGQLLLAAIGVATITVGILFFQYKMEIGQFIRKLRTQFIAAR